MAALAGEGVAAVAVGLVLLSALAGPVVLASAAVAGAALAMTAVGATLAAAWKAGRGRWGRR